MNYENTYSDYNECIKRISSLLYPQNHISEPPVLSPVTERICKDERIVQYIWNENLLKMENAKTISGKNIEIIKPGIWNDEMGPDFLSGEIIIGNKSLKGDIEIHVESSDWKRHKHHTNNLYKNVILHVFLEKTDDNVFDFRPDGNEIERLRIADYVFPDLESIEKTLSSEEHNYRKVKTDGECRKVFSSLEPEFLEHFLTLAGKERIREKVDRLKLQIDNGNVDQVFYQALMSSMGHKGSKPLFFLLSKRVPITEIKDFSKNLNTSEKSEMIESLLMHTANIAPSTGNIESGSDEESQRYLNRLNRWWAEFSPYFTDRIIPSTPRWFAGLRPANFPTRRIAAISRILSMNLTDANGSGSAMFHNFYRLFKNESESPMTARTVKLFLTFLSEKIMIDDKNSYWSGRFSFKNSKESKKQNLIGASSAKGIIFNAVIPTALLYAQMINDKKTENFIWLILDNHPPLSENILTKFMIQRLFGDNSKASAGKFDTELKQQALLKIFNEACGNNEVSCENCVFKKIRQDNIY